MNNTAKQIFLSLLVFVVGSAISQQNVAQLGNIDGSKSASKTFCQQLTNGSISTHSGDVDPLFDNASEKNTGDTQSKTVTSCNSLVNVLPAVNDFTFDADQQSINIGFYNNLLSSQTFVFQEPNPPRLG